MSLIQDHIVVTKPRRVVVGTDRNTDEVKHMIEVQEVVAEWWVPEGQELVGEFALQPWIEAGVRQQGWALTRKSAEHAVPDLDAPINGVRWLDVAEDMASAIRAGDPTAALDRYSVAEMQQAEFETHEHVFGEDANPTTLCRVLGCGVHYEEHQRALAQAARTPEWGDDDGPGDAPGSGE